MPKPTDYPTIPSLHGETELYTQRRSIGEAPTLYKFTINFLASFLGTTPQKHIDLINLNSAYAIGHRINLTYTPLSDKHVLVIFNNSILTWSVDYNVDVGNKQIELLFDGDPSAETEVDTFMVQYDY